MAKAVAFDPDRVAYFEAEGWRAYYDRQWFRLLRLMLGICQEQFRIPFPLSLQAAYYVARASLAWAPVEHDTRVVEQYYIKFYKIARRFSNLTFDPIRAGILETKYNDDHRRLVGQVDKTEFIATMVDLHCTLFGLTPEQARESAELRVLACNTVDLITGKTSTDIAGDWEKTQEYLRRCYRSIERERQKAPATPRVPVGAAS